MPIFKEQIEAGGPVTITHPDITRFFMTIPEASQLVLEAGAIGGNGEIFVFDMGEPVKIKDLAINMIRLSGLKEGEDIKIDKIYVCSICGYTTEGDLPDRCPVCGAGSDKFKEF